MKKRVFLLAVALWLLVLPLQSFAAIYNVTGQSIDVFVNLDTSVKIKERYFLQMSDMQMAGFKAETDELGNDLMAWENFDSRFSISIGVIENIKPRTATISLLVTDSTFVEITYELDKTIFSKTAETSRSVEYALLKEMMNKFRDKGFFVIPENTVITFILPLNTSVDVRLIQPEAVFSSDGKNNYVSWEGFTKINALNFSYVQWKEIQTVSIGLILKNFIEDENPNKWLLILLAILLAAFALLNREIITLKMFEFIEKTTELKKP